ncbi:UPF0057-domain-containing protein [Schizopora paradoxa]|uniref:UPF0057-domain-containing protein n=1 Tax=Schizopora paradoxa TaxID=27342 RepID=A0A0H2RWC5_9AGAM|nr:UPF0057-domain-containing protein [Schizopora paradoxa]
MAKASDILLIIIAIFFPPAAAFIITGCGCDLLINILLTILGYIPGHLHAFWLIYKKMKAEEMYGYQNFEHISGGHFRPNHGCTT